MDMTHPDILRAEVLGPPPWGRPAREFITCGCGRKIAADSGAKLWRMPNGDIACTKCIQEYAAEYFLMLEGEA